MPSVLLAPFSPPGPVYSTHEAVPADQAAVLQVPSIVRSPLARLVFGKQRAVCYLCGVQYESMPLSHAVCGSSSSSSGGGGQVLAPLTTHKHAAASVAPAYALRVSTRYAEAPGIHCLGRAGSLRAKCWGSRPSCAVPTLTLDPLGRESRWASSLPPCCATEASQPAPRSWATVWPLTRATDALATQSAAGAVLGRTDEASEIFSPPWAQ